MSLVLIILFLMFSVYLIAHFGGRISAKNSFSWWFILFFLFIAALYPDFYRQVADFLGIELVSNLIIAGVILFLFKQSLESSTLTTKLNRKFRDFTSLMTAQQYVGSKGEVESGVVEKKRILVLLPTYNEEESLPVVIERIKAMVNSTSDFQIDVCFLNDGSEDHTLEVLKDKAQGCFASHPVNMGVSAVLLTGMKIAQLGNYDYLIQCDADGQHPIEVIPQFIQVALNKKVDLLVGSRFSMNMDPLLQDKNDENSLISTTPLRRLGGLLIHTSLLLFGRKAYSTDPTSGFRIYSSNTFRFLERNMPDDYPEPETIALVSMAGFAKGEVFVNMTPRCSGTSSLEGFSSIQYMVKVITAILALRIRSCRRIIKFKQKRFDSKSEVY